MFPGSARFNFRDAKRAGAVCSCDSNIFKSITNKYLDFANVFFGKHCFNVFFSNGAVASALKCSVSYIVSIFTNEKVFRANAFSVVAFVTNMKPAGDFSIVHAPRHPMRSIWAITGNGNPSIPNSVYVGSPFPTIISFAYLFPKSLFERPELRHGFLYSENVVM